MEFCNRCFLDLAYKRIKKHIRSESGMGCRETCIKKDDTLLIVDSLTKAILPKIVNKPVNVIFKPIKLNELKNIDIKKLIKTVKADKNQLKNLKILLPICLDDIEKEHLEQSFNGKKPIQDKKTALLKSKTAIYIYLPLTKEEVALLAKLNKIKNPLSIKKDSISKFLDKFETEFPGTKFKVKKSILTHAVS